MTLTSRVSAFFLAMLALVLVGFSLGIFLLARVYLLRQVDVRLESALATLSAAAEVTEDGVEWEPHERTLVLDEQASSGPLYWLIAGEEGKIIDRSSAADAVRLQQASEGAGHGWEIKTRRIATPAGTTLASQVRTSSTSAAPPLRNRHLDVLVGVRLEPIEAQLRTVLLTVSALSAVSFGLAFVVGRQLCQRALSPVSQMATAARGMSAPAIEQRLPVSDSKDELADLAQAFNALLDRVQESLERQGRFTAEASHQLRTPLTAMLGQVEVALRRDRPPEEYVHVLELVQSQAHELRQLIDSLLFLSRADEEALVPELEEIRLADWLPAYLAARQASRRREDIRLELEANLPSVRAHSVLLGQLLENLLDNACKYSPIGSAIAVRASAGDGSVQISVSDEGPGISPADQAHLFKPFHRGEAARAKGIRGSGLGLAIAARLAKALGGSLSLDETRSQGTTFVLRLPRV